MEEPKLISETLKYEGKIFKVVQRELEQEDGTVIIRDVVIKRSTVLGLIFNERGEVYVQQEYRSGINRVTWGFPSGIIEDENPIMAIKREVLEETGYELLEDPVIHAVGALSEGFTNESQFVGICKVNTNNVRYHQNLDEGEHITNGKWVKPDEITNSILYKGVSLDDTQQQAEKPHITSMAGQFALSTYCFSSILNDFLQGGE